jgi:hypothetical protein
MLLSTTSVLVSVAVYHIKASGLTIFCFDIWELIALLHCGYLHVGVLLGEGWQQLVKILPASSQS